MGKPYKTELEQLGDTYLWAAGVPVEALSKALSSVASLPLAAVGSGGSLTAAHVACFLHQMHSGVLARAFTPLDLISSKVSLRNMAVIVLTASGQNPDVRALIRDVVRREPRRCIVLCLKKNSSVSHLAKAAGLVDLFDNFNPPSGKDGFLATNSLVAFSVLLVRAYAIAFGKDDGIPKTLGSLVAGGDKEGQYLDHIRTSCRPIWRRETILVLYGGATQPAAMDLESKFSEAALGNVQVSDFRNFAHGRHHWLAARGAKSAVLALYSPDEERIATKTLELLPPQVAVSRIKVPAISAAAIVGGIVAALYVVAAAGEHHKVDPGRPSIPQFGRRMYRLRVFGQERRSHKSANMAISRKLESNAGLGSQACDGSDWFGAYERFISSLTDTAFGAVVLDYDGTLCDERDRFSGMRPEIVDCLVRLLRSGTKVGVATGRGKSVKEDLRRAIPPESWKDTYLGYYNGAELSLLSDDKHPLPAEEPCESLFGVDKALSLDPAVLNLATCERRRSQISIHPKLRSSSEALWNRVSQISRCSFGQSDAVKPLDRCDAFGCHKALPPVLYAESHTTSD